ncbi:restriction endonuclease subunit S [Aeromonas veronii]|uniref:restriction endonuclease subunit S n=1 Tax=Aeromonas hydrophila TaxID=644 RepID=UPI0016508661|nr:restriction endonuclease subunit S [Aeromonas hydrophila]
MAIENLITDHLDLWTAAVRPKNSAGRGSNSKQELTGIKKLRELILELAVSGKLVPQDASDEPASVLLERIAAEKTRLVEEGRIKKLKKLPEIREEDTRFELPKGWALVRFGHVSEHNSGKTLDQGRNQGILRDYITTSNLYWGRFDLSEVKQMPVQDSELEKCLATANDLLICEGGEAGRAAVWEQDYDICFQNHIHRARFYGGISPHYILRFFQMMSFTGEINNYRKGVGISNMSGKALSSILLPLPPIAEQNRIVAKVDELMALCDQLEHRSESLLAAHQTLVETLLATLTDSGDVDELEKNWERLCTHFDTLFTTEASIDTLKQTILQLAVTGKLVPQDPNDEPASYLLESIEIQKTRLVNEGKFKKGRSLPKITEDEIPAVLPDGWAYDRIGTFSHVGTGATPSRSDMKYWEPASINWVTSGETSELFIFNTREKVSPLAIEETNVSIYPVGTLIIAMYGQGKTRGQISELMVEAGTNQACAAIVMYEQSSCLKDYVKLYFRKAYSELREQAAGGAQPNLNVGKIASTIIPLPPLEEQKRILSKVEELMFICDQLKLRLNNAQNIQLRLTDSIVHQTTGIPKKNAIEHVSEGHTMKITTILSTTDNFSGQVDGILANLIEKNINKNDARDIWIKSNLELPVFYKQLKKEIDLGYIHLPTEATFSV